MTQITHITSELMVLQAHGVQIAMWPLNPYRNHRRKTQVTVGRMLPIHDQTISSTSHLLPFLAWQEVQHNRIRQDRQRVSGKQVLHLVNRHNRRIRD